MSRMTDACHRRAVKRTRFLNNKDAWISEKETTMTEDPTDLLIRCQRLGVDLGNQGAALLKIAQLQEVVDDLGRRQEWAEENGDDPVLWQTLKVAARKRLRAAMEALKGEDE
jgi:hypothetical protein